MPTLTLIGGRVSGSLASTGRPLRVMNKRHIKRLNILQAFVVIIPPRKLPEFIAPVGPPTKVIG